MALTDKLSAIGDAIREKTGKTDLMTLDAMPAEIASITTGGGGEGLPEEAFVITGDCSYRFANDGWNWFIENYGNQITTNQITDLSNMFYWSKHLTKIPFAINCASNSVGSQSAFSRCDRLTTLPLINNFQPSYLYQMFAYCYSLREFPEGYGENWDWSYLLAQTSTSNGRASNMFSNCFSLRHLPMELLKYQNKAIKYNYSMYYSMADCCYTLDEIIDLPIPYTATWTSNAFSSIVSRCYRLKNFTFAKNDDGSPIAVKWKSQVLDLSSVGYSSNDTYMTGYNSGITADKKVKDDATYQALKDDADWYSLLPAYSRYNHDSAVATINSLPDASAYGTNTIKFTGSIGSATDGGAINTLTEEEIAVATAKGWTVTLV